MKISELIKRLKNEQEHLGDLEVMIADGFNGGGCPRDLNYGPCHIKISDPDAEESADCENRVGEDILLIGFGCY
ncbi:hypothetical protein ACQ4M3_09710 [Leptolyngbya sp. AN03gr2]|uniref:hypothetical protein n=1 Tax=Leptolyngbya sp. AN03gr2 TaxID=3423364 RepID=UPI003D31315D